MGSEHRRCKHSRAPTAVFWKLNKSLSKRHSLDFVRLGGIHQTQAEETRQMSRGKRMLQGGWSRRRAQKEKLRWAVHAPCLSPVGLLTLFKCTQACVLIRNGKMTDTETTTVLKRTGQAMAWGPPGEAPGERGAEASRGPGLPRGFCGLEWVRLGGYPE